MSNAGSVVVAGAGPHALTACAYLVDADATLIDRLVVVDPDGWLVHWNRKLEALGIEWLRSSCVHHPDPDPFALVETARACTSSPAHLVRGPYKTPSRVFFDRFCEALTSSLGLHARLVRDRVVGLRPGGDGVRAQLGSGRVLDASRVVMATNPRRDNVPGFAAGALDRGANAAVAHSSDLDLRRADIAGRRIAVVGAGLTAVQLVTAAARRGAHATLITRRPLSARTFDVTPGWMTYKLASFIEVGDAGARGRSVRAARGRGTVPEGDLALLDRDVRAGYVRVCERTVVQTLTARGGDVVLHTSAGRMSFDHLWLATGSRADLCADAALRELQGWRPVAVAGGLPVLDAHCRWPGTQVHLMGELSALQTGPLAPNLAGARIAAERIACAAGRPPRQYPIPSELAVVPSGPE